MFVNLPVINTCTCFLVLFSLLFLLRGITIQILGENYFLLCLCNTAKRIYRLEAGTMQLKSCLTQAMAENYFEHLIVF